MNLHVWTLMFWLGRAQGRLLWRHSCQKLQTNAWHLSGVIIVPLKRLSQLSKFPLRKVLSINRLSRWIVFLGPQIQFGEAISKMKEHWNTSKFGSDMTFTNNPIKYIGFPKLRYPWIMAILPEKSINMISIIYILCSMVDIAWSPMPIRNLVHEIPLLWALCALSDHSIKM